MCRISGIVEKGLNSLETDINTMTTSMAHGGPDGSGYYIDADAGVAFGHRRLAIIDLSDAGKQPMSCGGCDEYTVSYNGEVYNFQELRKELTAEGYSFTSTTDTEVILKGYECWGEACFSKLKGMFAIAIHDKRKQEVILARDPMGIKPLYYYQDKDSLYFASEIRAFKSLGRFKPNEDWRVYFYTYGFLPEPITTLDNVKPLERGHYLKYNVTQRTSETISFYNHSYTSSIASLEEAKEVISTTLEKAMDRHLISDAPIGFFLSGGIDSSLLTLLGDKFKREDIHTLSIIFNNENYSEKEYQELIVKETNATHHPYLLEKDMFLDALPDIFEAMDQPSTDGINTYFICSYAKKAGLKAVISGLGADELLGGYSSFNNASITNKLRKLPNVVLQQAKRIPQYKYKKISFLERQDPLGDYLFNRGYYSTDESAKILGTYESDVKQRLEKIRVPEFVSSLSSGNKTSYLESSIYMQSQLLKDTDAMSMWHSTEVRVPFLDVDFVNAVHSISSELKFSNPVGKYLLIESFKDLLPREIWDRKKQGFVFPFQEWMKSNKGDVLEGRKNERLERLYQSGKLNWSRYWVYLIANLHKD